MRYEWTAHPATQDMVAIVAAALGVKLPKPPPRSAPGKVAVADSAAFEELQRMFPTGQG